GPAAAGAQQSQEHAQGGGLAGAVGPEQPVDLAGGGGERQVGHRPPHLAAGDHEVAAGPLPLDHPNDAARAGPPRPILRDGVAPGRAPWPAGTDFASSFPRALRLEREETVTCGLPSSSALDCSSAPSPRPPPRSTGPATTPGRAPTTTSLPRPTPPAPTPGRRAPASSLTSRRPRTTIATGSRRPGAAS